MSVTQVFATILFFAVMIELFIACSLYLWKILGDYIKAGKAKKPEDTTKEQE